MRKLCSYVLIILLFSCSIQAVAQKVYSCNNRYDTDIKIFVAENRYDADLRVYKVCNAYDADGNCSICLSYISFWQVRIF